MEAKIVKRTAIIYFRHALLTVAPILFLASVPCAFAQFNARLSGTVTDSSGAVVGSAAVKLTEQSSRAVKTFTTNPSGFYNFSELAPGTYSLEASAKGFKAASFPNITIVAEAARDLDVKLETGGASETVTVSANDVPLLNTSDASVSTNFSSADVTRLPEFGRDPYELLRLTPGVVSDAARSGSGSSVSLPNNQSGTQSNSGIFQTENQVQASAAGQRVTSNTYLIDGVSVDSLSHGGSAVVTPNPESVAQITAASSNFDAGEGRNVGLHTRVVTKASSNNIHGSLFFQYDEPGLNASPSYGAPAGGLPVRDQNKQREYAASIGFPILKDRLFFFGSYEGITNINSGTSEQYVPTPQFFSALAAQRSGGIVSTILTGPGGGPQVVRVLPTSCANLAFNNTPAPAPAQACTQLPGGVDIGSLSGGLGTLLPNYSAATPNAPNSITGGGLDGIPDVEFAQVLTTSHYRGNQFNARVDYNFTPRDQLALSGFIVKLDQTSPDPGTGAQPLSNLPFKPFNTSATAVYIHTFTPSLINEARSNFTRYADNQITDAGNIVDFGIPRFEVQGFVFGRLYDGPIQGSTTPGIFAQNTYELQDTLIQTFGSHTIRYGGSYRWEQDNDNLSGGSRPDYVFNRIWNYANDATFFESVAANPANGGPANGQRYFRDADISAFVQHDWKALPNLTLNTGLRWEYFGPLRNKGFRINQPVFGPDTNTYLTNAVLAPVNHIFNSNFNNWSPRVGFNWVPPIQGSKLVVSGGFGIAYDRIDDQLYLPGFENGPNYGSFNLFRGDAQSLADAHITFGRGANRSAFSYAPNPYLAVGVDPVTGLPVGAGEIEVYGDSQRTAQPMLESFSMQLQRQLPYGIVAGAAYQGSVGHHFIRLVNQNFLHVTTNGTTTGGSTGNGTTPFYAAYLPTTDVATNYNGVNLTMNKRFAHGYNINAVYTFAKSLDQGSNEGPGALSNQTDPANPITEYGPSDFDVRHSIRVSGNWDLPKYHNGHGLVGQTVSGWQINGIFQFRTGFPWTPVTGQPTVALVQSAATLSPTRPIGYFGGAHNSCSNNNFINGGNFPGGGRRYFNISQPGPPGIGRNSFTSPCYLDTDLTAAKEQPITIFGHESQLRFQANFYNAFNKLNLAPISFGTNEATVENSLFGLSPSADEGRVIEFFGRFQF